jgi:hypothetical protein
MATMKCTCGYEIDYIPGGAGPLKCPSCERVHRILDAAPGALSVDGVEANLVWRAGPRRFTAWAAAKIEGDETDRSLALVCCQIAVEIAKARALRKKRSGGQGHSDAKNDVSERVRKQFAKIGLDFDKLSFADKLVEIELLRHAFVHEGQVITKSEAYDAVKAANAAIEVLEK